MSVRPSFELIVRLCLNYFGMHFPLFYLLGIGGGVQCRAIQHGGRTAPVAGRKGTDAGDHKETEG